MRRIGTFLAVLMVIFIFTGISNATGLLTENFNYSGPLVNNGWTAFSGNGTNSPTTVGNVDLSYPGYTGVGGNSVSLTTNGEDDSHPFNGAASVSSGEVYCSALINVAAAQATGDYFLSLYSSAGYFGRLFVKSSGAGFTFGISKNTTSPNYSAATYTYGVTYLVVIHYSFVTGSGNDPVYLYVNPTLKTAEPIGSPTASATVTETDNTGGISMLALRQGTAANAPTLNVDGIIVATTWDEVIAAAFYTWNQTGSADYTVSSNWTPARTTPSVTDILVFNNGASTTVTNIPTQTIYAIQVSGNTTVNFQAAAANTLSLGSPSTPTTVASGSALNISETNALSLKVLTGAKASISGTMDFSAANHTLVATDAGGVTFQSGSVFTQDLQCLGNVFGASGTTGGVVFASGSEFISKAGSNPFVNNSPNSLVVFQTGSLYSQRQATVTFSGMVYADYEFNFTGSAVSQTGTSGFSANNFSVIAGTLNVNLTTGTAAVQINGNISVSTGATLTFTPATASALTLAGTGAQTITHAGTLTFGPNEGLTINNSTGVTLNSPITIQGVFTLTSGLLTTTATNLLTLGAAATVAGGSNTSFVNGPIAVTARNTIPMVAPVGKGSAYRPLTSTIAITSGTGTFTVEQFETPPTGSISVSGVASLSTTRYFHITKTGTVTGSATLTLSWGADDGVVTPSNMTVVTGTNGGQWSVADNGGGFTGIASAGTVSTLGHSETANVGDFTLGFLGYHTYYSAATGALNVITTWGTATDGTGTNPPDFVQSNQILNIQNRATATITGNWSIDPTSKIVTGDGTNPINFTIPVGFSVTGLVDVSNHATLTLQNTTIPTLGNLTGTVVFAGSSAQTIPAATFTNLTINNASGVTLGASSTVNGSFALVNGLVTTTAANKLTLGANAIVNGGSSTSFVNGPITLTAKVGATLMAPVGKGTAYRPLWSHIYSLTGSGTLTAEQIETPPTGTVNAFSNMTLSHVRYFHVTESGLTAGNVDLTLSWGSDDVVLDPTTITVLGTTTNGGNWSWADNKGGFTGSSSAGTVKTAPFTPSNNALGDCAIGSYSGNPLPVNLTSFTAVPSNGAMKLSWKTSVETGNQGFDVERSTDKSVWTSLTFIQGQGNSNTAKSYSYSDNSITKAGKYYYRLKQIDNSGGYKYSDIAEVDYAVPTAYSLNQNYPNPFNPNTMISYALPIASNVKISVYNAIGETVQILENGFKSAGNYTVSFNASNVPSGIYFYRIDAGTFTQVRKMMLLK
jgi:hypothetical protein